VNGEPRGAATAGGQGFTLVEVAVVIIMIGVLSAVAVVFIKPRSFAATARGYADEIAALCDATRQRAVATRTQQRLVLDGDQVVHSQAIEPGMQLITDEDDWAPVGTLPVPSEVAIAAIDNRPHIDSADLVPSPGTGLGTELVFMPDGSTQPATIFVEDSRSEIRARVVIYPATGSAYVYRDW
jgi:prepilin-type N-terminal cleavage/methylation domain-containing protein